MDRKKSLLIFIIITSILLTGCWNYVGLNEFTIVTGVAIDKDKKSGDYHITFEIVDTVKSNSMTGTKTTLVEYSGPTIYETVKNCKKRMSKRLYFGVNKIVIISEEIAKDEGLEKIINWFLRDYESRETINFLVSQEKTAREFLTQKPIVESIISYKIQKVIEEDQAKTLSTREVQLYSLYDSLQHQLCGAVLPAFKLSKNGDDKIAESNGIAAFKDGKLVGYLTPNETKYYLFAIDEVYGGVLSIASDNDKDQDVSLEISNSKTKSSYKFKDDKFVVSLKISFDALVDELSDNSKWTNQKEIKKMENKINKKIEENIKKTVKKVQTKLKTDIFGFNQLIHDYNSSQFEKVKKNWDKYFKEMEVKVEVDSTIVNTGHLR